MALPPLNGLRIFEAASRHMSFKRAAEELNVTPTAVSHQIRRLEEFLGTRLFLRQNRGLELTREAQEYLPSVRVAFEELRKATARLRQRDGAEKLTVSTLTYVGARWIVQRLGSFKARHPNIAVFIMTSSEPVEFGTGGADVGIRRGNGRWARLRADWLMNQKLLPVLSPRLLHSGPPIRTADDLARFPLLHVASEPSEWRRWFDFAGADRADVAQGMTFDQSITAIQAAIDGLGVALGRTPFVQAELDAGLLVAPIPLLLGDDEDFYIVAPEDTADRAPVSAFREWMLSEVHADRAPSTTLLGSTSMET